MHNVTTAQQSRLYRSDAIKRRIDSIYPEPDEMAARRMGVTEGKGNQSCHPPLLPASVTVRHPPAAPPQSHIWEVIFDFDYNRIHLWLLTFEQLSSDDSRQGGREKAERGRRRCQKQTTGSPRWVGFKKEEIGDRCKVSFYSCALQ